MAPKVAVLPRQSSCPGSRHLWAQQLLHVAIARGYQHRGSGLRLAHRFARCRQTVVCLPASRSLQAHAPQLLHLLLERAQRVAPAAAGRCRRGPRRRLAAALPPLAALQVLGCQALALLLRGTLACRRIEDGHHQLRLAGGRRQEAQPIGKAAGHAFARAAGGGSGPPRLGPGAAENVLRIDQQGVIRSSTASVAPPGAAGERARERA